MKTLFAALAEELSAGRGAVLCTVIASRGSTPRGPGARMLVRADGSTVGTVGGGAVELEAGRLAQALCREGRSLRRTYRLTNSQAGDLGMVCGGEADLFFQSLSPAALPQVQAVCQALEARTGPRWLVTALTGDSWRWDLSGGDGLCPGLPGVPAERLRPLLGKGPALEEGDPALFVQPLAPAGTVYLFGAGHVGLALVHLLDLTGFAVTVCDQRPFPPGGIPGAGRTVQCSYDGALDRLGPMGPEDYAVIMTPGHEGDYQILRQVLRTPARYIGCIGSRRKIAATRERLLAEGFTEADIARVHAPIGLDIGGETPQEVALSVAAQLVACRSGKPTRREERP